MASGTCGARPRPATIAARPCNSENEGQRLEQAAQSTFHHWYHGEIIVCRALWVVNGANLGLQQEHMVENPSGPDWVVPKQAAPQP